MARSLKNLMRLHEWRLDEKRRQLGELLALMEEFEARARKLEEDLIAEQEVAREAPEEAGYIYGNYARAVIERRERIADSIAKLEIAITAAREQVREAYRELKKFELAQASRDRREALERTRREQGVLDEIGMQRHLRQGQPQ